MPKSRPSYPQIRARQRNILEYQAYSKLSDKQAAKHFGVSQREYDRFTNTHAKDLRKTYSRSTQMQKLFGAGDSTLQKASRKAARENFNVKYTRLGGSVASERRISETLRSPGLNEQYKVRVSVFRERVGFLYGGTTTPSQCWAQYTSRNGIPQTIKALKLLARNNRVPDFEKHVQIWKSCYFGDTSEGDYRAAQVLARD